MKSRTWPCHNLFPYPWLSPSHLASTKAFATEKESSRNEICSLLPMQPVSFFRTMCLRLFQTLVVVKMDNKVFNFVNLQQNLTFCDDLNVNMFSFQAFHHHNDGFASTDQKVISSRIFTDPILVLGREWEILSRYRWCVIPRCINYERPRG